MWEYLVHWFPCTERLGDEGEHGRDIAYEVGVKSFRVVKEGKSPAVFEVTQGTSELSKA